MKACSLWSLALALLLSISPAVFADSYGKAGGDLVFLMDADYSQPDVRKKASYHSGYGLLAGVGWRFGSLAVEGELLQHSNSLSTFSGQDGRSDAAGDLTLLAGFINGQYRLVRLGYFSPFIMAGVGAASISLSGASDGANKLADADDIVVAGQLGLGCEAKLTPQLFLEGGWRYLLTDTVDFSGTDVDYRASLLWVGLKYYFQPQP